MGADYKNWMPKGMVASFTGGAVGSWIAALGVHILMPEGTVKHVMTGVSTASGVLFSGVSVWSYLMYRAFDYNGKRQLSRQIISGIADYVDLPEEGSCLDVGCGSGALAIAIAKRNPKAHVTGIDRWGKEYASFNKELCEGNARAEGVSNVRFLQGDATQLDFPDETFDAVASNYVYHNIPSKDRQAILLETLRTLKRTAAMSFSGSHLPLLLLEIWRLSILCRRARGKGYWKQQADPVTRFRPGAALTAAPEDAVRRSTIPQLPGKQQPSLPCFPGAGDSRLIQGFSFYFPTFNTSHAFRCGPDY